MHCPRRDRLGPPAGSPWKPPRKYKEEIVVKQLLLGGALQAPAIALGCMRINLWRKARPTIF